jgi:glycosyltransferase involved in cell wall biosynthesis
MQNTDFGVEILIHDDASTDNTPGILKEYADRYPDKIFPLFETENKYSHGYKGRMDIVFNYARAKGNTSPHAKATTIGPTRTNCRNK